jgi:hypothetical protein
MAWLKNGLQACPRCGGKGCYRCHKKGVIVLCPGCANTAPNLMVKKDNNYACHLCKVTFSRSGEILSVDVEKPKPPKRKSSVRQ